MREHEKKSFPNFLGNQTNVHTKYNNNKFRPANFNKADRCIETPQ